MNIKHWRHGLMLLVITITAGCSGGVGGTGSSNGGGTATVISTGTMTKGSVIVNGVRYEDTTANIVIDDTPKVAADLRDGMVVKVRGTINADGINGTAEKVEAQIEVRGTPTSVNASATPPSLVVLGQTVIADDQTVYSNLANFAAITTSTLIEVHGLRDAQGNIRATRIEANTAQMGDYLVDEIRGVVSGGAAGNNPTTFNIGSQAINATSAVIAPNGASYQNGDVVEVHCSSRPCVNGSSVFLAARVEVENAEDAEFQPSSGQRYEVEGLISGYNGTSSFSVAGKSVTTTGSTRFVGGIATDLVDNIKVEAEGSWNGSTLTATKIEFKRSVVRLQGAVTAAGSNSFTMNVAGNSVNIETDSFTSGAVPPVDPSGCAQVRGQRKAGGGVVVTAGEIKNCSGGGGSRHLMQAPVENKSPESNITLLGTFVIDVSNPTDTPNKWLDINGIGITRTQFFNAVTPASPGPPAVAGTLVKITFDNNNVDVKQVEIED